MKYHTGLLKEGIVLFLLIMVLQCVNSTSSGSGDNPYADHVLDCATPKNYSGPDVMMVDIFNSDSVCIQSTNQKPIESPFSPGQYISWNGLDYKGDTVESGVYYIEATIFSQGMGQTICTFTYIDNEKVPPEPPASLQVTPGNEMVSLSWSLVEKATSYYICYQEGETIDSNCTCRHSEVVSDTTVNNLVNGKTYSFAVKAANGGGISEPCSTVTITLPIPEPEMPSVEIEVGHKTLSVKWHSVKYTDAYEVFYKIGDSWLVEYDDTIRIEGAEKRTVSGIGIELNDLENCTGYIIGVAAVNGSGYSRVSEVRAVPALPYPSVTMARMMDSTLMLYWDEVPGAESYDVIRLSTVSGDKDSVFIEEVLQPFAVTDIYYDTSYYFMLRATDSSGRQCGTITNSFIVQTLRTPEKVATTTDNSAVFLTWEEVDRARGYRVYICRGDTVTDTDSSKIVTDPETGFGNLVNGAQYTFTVEAFYAGSNDTTWSDFSPLLSVVPMPTAPDSVTVFTGDSIAVVDPILHYEDHMNFDSFSVYYTTGDSIELLNSEPYRTATMPCTLSGLVPHTWYNIALVCHDSVHTAPMMGPYAVYTSTVKNFSVLKVDVGMIDSAITFRWDTIPGATGYILNYTTESWISTRWFSLVINNTNTNDPGEYTFFDPDQDYYGSVMARYPGGYSFPSDTVIFHFE